jgi:hypothetical protein
LTLATQTPYELVLLTLALTLPIVVLSEKKEMPMLLRRAGQSSGAIGTEVSDQVPVNQQRGADLVWLARFVTAKQTSVVVPLVMNLFVGGAQLAVDSAKMKC